MKKFYCLLGCVCLAVSLVSCKEDAPVEPDPSDGVGGRTVLTAVVEHLEITPPQSGDSASQSVADEGSDSSDDGHRVWTKADKIGVFGSQGGANAKYTLYNESDGEASGKFYGPEVRGDVYAYYPYAENVTMDGSKVALGFPAEQTYDADVVKQFRENTELFIAKSTDGNLEFLHPLGCLGVGIKGGISVKSVTLSSGSHPLAGTIGLDFADDFEASSVTGSLRSVKLVLEQPVTVDMEVPTVFYLMIPPAVYDDLTVSVETADGSFSKSVVGEFVVERISMLDIEQSVGNTTVVAEFDALELDGQSDNGARVWKDNAVFGIFSDDIVNSQYTIMSGEAGKSSATFVGVESDGDIIAYYPYTPNAVLKDDILTLPVASTQTYNADLLSHFKENTPFMVAAAAPEEKIVFKYLSGVLGIKVKADCNVKSVVVTRKSGGLSGNFNVDTSADLAMIPSATGSRNMITLNCGDGVATTTADPTVFYVLVPPAVYDDLSVKVTTTSGDTLFATIDRPCDIPRLSVTDLGKDVAYITVSVDIDPEAAANKGGKCEWAADDEIIVYDSASSSVKKATLLSGAGTANGVFKVSNSSVEDVYEWVAYAPSVAFLNEALSFASQYSATIRGGEGSYGTGMTPLFARNNGSGFRAKSMMGCMAVRVKGNVTVTGITVKNGSLNIASDNKVQVELASADTAVPVTTLASASFQTTYIYLSSEEGVPVSSSDYTTFYVNVPAGIDWNALQIGVVTTEGSFVKTVSACDAVNANAAPVTVAEIDFDAVRTAAATAIDLSANGHYANSYIVEPNGLSRYYSFDLKHVDGTDTANPRVPGRFVYSQMVWATAYDLVYDLWFDSAAGKIYFKYDGQRRGNAKIAVTDAKYDIGWVYHIWCTDTPKDIHVHNNLALNDGQGVHYYWMDRNIGATYAPFTKSECVNISAENAVAACGFQFQFGNLNGYPGVESISAATKNEGSNFANRKNYVIYGFSQYVQSAFKVSTVLKSSADDAMRYPNYVYAEKGRWLTSNIECNGYKTTDAACLWWTTNNEPLKIDKKSKYDPCPYGYVIPNQSMLYHAVERINGTATKRTFTGVSSGVDGVWYGAYSEDNDGNYWWFPASGYGAAKLGNAGASTYMYGSRNGSSNPVSLDIPAYCVMSIKESCQPGWSTMNNVAAGSYVPTGGGYSIRCIRHIQE